jgi:putative oxidoreductase
MSSVVAIVGRALMCAIFVEEGLAKLLAPAGAIGMMASHGLPLPMVTYIVVLIIEIGGGLAILLGFQIRAVAALMAVYCIATALIAHYHPDDQDQMIHFMKNICMAGGFLQLVAWGGGRYTVTRN